VRTYKFPDLTPCFVLGAHRAAVNAVSVSETLIVSGSGDRSIRLWDAQTGELLRTFENHHTRGYVSFLSTITANSKIVCLPFLTIFTYSIASIDFKPPYILSGSSDKHIRLFDITSLQGWSTSPEYEHNPPPVAPFPLPFPYAYDGGTPPCAVCHVCGNIRDGAGSSNTGPGADGSVRNGAGRRVRGGDEPCTHGDLVRSVVLGEDFVLSGSYDLSIKVSVFPPCVIFIFIWMCH